MPEATNPERGDETRPRVPDEPVKPLPEALHLLNSEESDFFDTGIRRRSKVAANVALDGLFVLGFAAISFVVDHFLHLIPLSGIAANTRDVVSAVFALGTIGCAILMMLADLLELAKELFRR